MKRHAMVLALTTAALSAGVIAADAALYAATAHAVVADIDSDGMGDSSDGTRHFLPSSGDNSEGFSWGNGYQPRP